MKSSLVQVVGPRHRERHHVRGRGCRRLRRRTAAAARRSLPAGARGEACAGGKSRQRVRQACQESRAWSTTSKTELAVEKPAASRRRAPRGTRPRSTPSPPARRVLGRSRGPRAAAADRRGSSPRPRSARRRGSLRSSQYAAILAVDDRRESSGSAQRRRISRFAPFSCPRDLRVPPGLAQDRCCGAQSRGARTGPRGSSTCRRSGSGSRAVEHHQMAGRGRKPCRSSAPLRASSPRSSTTRRWKYGSINVSVS